MAKYLERIYISRKVKVLGISALIVALVVIISKLVLRNTFDSICYIDNIGGICALLLFMPLGLVLFENGKKRFVIGMSLFGMGGLLNLAVGVVNRGNFPVSGYTPQEFSEVDCASYYVLDSEAPLAFLGDHACLWGGSIGDIFAVLGEVLIVSVLCFTVAKDKRTIKA